MNKIKKTNLNPAAWGALNKGDLENFIVATTPGGIEAQEAQGQQSFVNSSVLPIGCNHCTREDLESMGIVFGEAADDLFVNVTLPEGWQKVATDHHMWSKLIDEKGRERAAVFYKAAFYDRRSHISLTPRFSCRVEPVCGYDDPSYEEAEWHCVVMDCGKVTWVSTQRAGIEPDYKDDKEQWLAWSNRKDELYNLGKKWLDEKYPDYQNPLAYWI